MGVIGLKVARCPTTEEQMSVMVDDLRFAQQANKAVEVHFFGMPKVLTGVVEVDEDREC